MIASSPIKFRITKPNQGTLSVISKTMFLYCSWDISLTFKIKSELKLLLYDVTEDSTYNEKQI